MASRRRPGRCAPERELQAGEGVWFEAQLDSNGPDATDAFANKQMGDGRVSVDSEIISTVPASPRDCNNAVPGAD